MRSIAPPPCRGLQQGGIQTPGRRFAFYGKSKHPKATGLRWMFFDSEYCYLPFNLQIGGPVLRWRGPCFFLPINPLAEHHLLLARFCFGSSWVASSHYIAQHLTSRSLKFGRHDCLASLSAKQHLTAKLGVSNEI